MVYAYDIIILDPVCLGPGAHDPRIVESNDGDDIHAF